MRRRWFLAALGTGFLALALMAIIFFDATSERLIVASEQLASAPSPAPAPSTLPLSGDGKGRDSYGWLLAAGLLLSIGASSPVRWRGSTETSNPGTKPRVLVVDDDLQTLKLLRFLLEDAGYEVMVASSLRLARQILEDPTGSISLMILDVMMPGTDGLDFCRQIRQEGEAVPIIFLSARGEAEARTEGLRVGADDYLAKPFDPAELLARMTAVLWRARTSLAVSEAQPLLRMGEVELDAAMLKVRTARGREADLTPTETKLLHCLMRNAGRVLTRDVLINQVWDYGYDGGSNTVEVHIRRLRKKVETDPHSPHYIRTVRGVGYIFKAA